MIVTVTGGASCGKSEIAENIAVRFGGKKGYFAAMKPYGEEGRRRIERHRRQREGKNFYTVECWRGLKKIPYGSFDTVLFECVPNLLANMFFDGGLKDWQTVFSAVRELAESVENIVVVTGDVFFEPLFYGKDIIAYIEALGRINSGLAAVSDTVVETVAGVPVYLKGCHIL